MSTELDEIEKNMIIEGTVGHEFMKGINKEDIEPIMGFLKIIWNYKKLQRISNTEYI